MLVTLSPLLYKTNRSHVAVRLFSYLSQMTSSYGKNISATPTNLFLPHFDLVCDLLNLCPSFFSINEKQL